MNGIYRWYQCPACGEQNETFLDPTAGRKQTYVEDCAVCCRPNVLVVEMDPATGAAFILVESEA